MNSRAFRRGAVAVGAIAASAIVLAGCAGSGGGTPSSDDDGEVTLTARLREQTLARRKLGAPLPPSLTAWLDAS